VEQTSGVELKRGAGARPQGARAEQTAARPEGSTDAGKTVKSSPTVVEVSPGDTVILSSAQKTVKFPPGKTVRMEALPGTTVTVLSPEETAPLTSKRYFQRKGSPGTTQQTTVRSSAEKLVGSVKVPDGTRLKVARRKLEGPSPVEAFKRRKMKKLFTDQFLFSDALLAIDDVEKELQELKNERDFDPTGIAAKTAGVTIASVRGGIQGWEGGGAAGAQE
jgi:hypothetical protein